MSAPPPYASFGNPQHAPPAYASNFQQQNQYSHQSQQNAIYPTSPANYSHPQNSFGQQQFNSHNHPAQQSSQNRWFSQYYHTLNQQQLQHLQQWFNSVDIDKNGSISKQELSQMTMPGTGPFSGRTLGVAAATQLVNLFDMDGNGEIDFFEYAALHSFMDKLNAAFQNADANRNGTLDVNETTKAIHEGGFGIPPYCITRFFKQFQTNGSLDFIQFMHMAAEIAFIKAKFNGLDADKDGKLSLDEVLHLCADVTELNSNSQVVMPSVPQKPVSQVDNGCVIS